MEEGKSKSEEAVKLRRCAEEILREKNAGVNYPMSEEDVNALVHELEVHQIELELQNEELQRATMEAEGLRDKYIDLYDFAPVGYFTFNDQGIISSVNLPGAALLGVERRNLISRSFLLFVSADLRETFRNFCDAVITSHTKQTCELILLRNDKTHFDAYVEGVADLSGERRDTQIQAAIINITERRRAEKALQKSEKELTKKVKELKEFYDMAVDRELRMIELKKEIETLKKELERYKNPV